MNQHNQHAWHTMNDSHVNKTKQTHVRKGSIKRNWRSYHWHSFLKRARPKPSQRQGSGRGRQNTNTERKEAPASQSPSPRQSQKGSLDYSQFVEPLHSTSSTRNSDFPKHSIEFYPPYSDWSKHWNYVKVDYIIRLRKLCRFYLCIYIYILLCTVGPNR